jgi:hypothetical protein
LLSFICWANTCPSLSLSPVQRDPLSDPFEYIYTTYFSFSLTRKAARGGGDYFIIIIILLFLFSFFFVWPIDFVSKWKINKIFLWNSPPPPKQNCFNFRKKWAGAGGRVALKSETRREKNSNTSAC